MDMEDSNRTCQSSQKKAGNRGLHGNIGKWEMGKWGKRTLGVGAGVGIGIETVKAWTKPGLFRETDPPRTLRTLRKATFFSPA